MDESAYYSRVTRFDQLAPGERFSRDDGGRVWFKVGPSIARSGLAIGSFPPGMLVRPERGNTITPPRLALGLRFPD